MADHVTTMQNFKRIKIFDFRDTLSDADVRGELLEKCKRFNSFGIKISVDKNDQRVAYLSFAEHEEALRCLNELSQFLTIGNSAAAAVPVLSKTTKLNNFYVSSDKANVPLRGRGSVSNYRTDASRTMMRGRGSSSSYKTDMSFFRGRGLTRRNDFSAFKNERRSPPAFKTRPPNQTLYVGNLNKSTTADELKRIFGRYGFIEDINLKSTFASTYAFIRFFNLDMAAQARREMENAQIGGFFITLGFGEAPPSRCLWVGGIGPWTDEGEITREFQRFGKIDKFSWPPGKNYAYVLFQYGKSATKAFQELQGLPLGRDGKRIRLDYVSFQLIDSPLNYKDFEFEGADRGEEIWDFYAGNSRGISRQEFLQSSSLRRRSRSKDHSVDKGSERDRTISEKHSPNSRPHSPPMNRGSQARGNSRLNSMKDSPRDFSSSTNSGSQTRGKLPLSPGKNDDNYNSRMGEGCDSFARGQNSSYRGGGGVNNWERGGERGRRTNGTLRRPGGGRGSVGRAGRIDNFGGRNADERDSDKFDRQSSEGRRGESRDRGNGRRGNFNARGRLRGSYHRDEVEDRHARAGHRRDSNSGHDRDSYRRDRGSKQRSRSRDCYSGDRQSFQRHRRYSRDRDIERLRSRSRLDSFDRRSPNIERKRRKMHGGSRGSHTRRSSSLDRSSGSFARRSRSYERKSVARSSEARHRNKSRSVDAARDKNQNPIRVVSQSPTKRFSPSTAISSTIVSERSKPSSIEPPECRPLSNDIIIIEDIISGMPLASSRDRSDSLPVRYTQAWEQLNSASSRSPVNTTTITTTKPINPVQSIATTLTSSQSSLRHADEIPHGFAARAETSLGLTADKHINRHSVVSVPPASHQHPSSSTAPVNRTEGVNAEIAKRFPVVWSGAMVLKNSAFVTNMYLVSGSVPLVDSLLRDPSSPDCPVLKISQRLRLDDPQKLDELERRIASSGRNGCSVLLAAPAAAQVGDVNNVIQQRTLSSLGVYLHEKECAAVIFLPPGGGSSSDTGVLHAFPPSKFASEFLRKEAPDLVPSYPKDDHLLIIVMRDLTL